MTKKTEELQDPYVLAGQSRITYMGHDDKLAGYVFKIHVGEEKQLNGLLMEREVFNWAWEECLPNNFKMGNDTTYVNPAYGHTFIVFKQYEDAIAFSTKFVVSGMSPASFA